MHFVDRPEYEEENVDWHEVEIKGCRIRIKINDAEVDERGII